MSRRTKESLLAQHKTKTQGADISFSFAKFPGGKALQFSLIFAFVGVSIALLPLVLPDVGRDIYRTRAINSVSRFELTNDIFKGLFKRNAHSGDSKPDPEATFMAVSILTNSGIRLKNEEFTQIAINQLEASDFNNNTEQIYHGIVQLRGLGLLKEGTVSNQYTDKYYSILLGLTERHSAFRLNSERSASVSATYYAFQAIKELGKMEQFKQQEEFNSAIHFVASMKDTQTGGFRDVTGQNATLLSTWQAIHVLAEQLPRKSEVVTKALEGVARFVFSCQARDGGFFNSPSLTTEQLYHAHSNMSTTSQALYILEFLKENNLLPLSFSDPAWVYYYEGNNYLRACLSLRHGVLGSYPSDAPDLEATYYFLRFVNDFPRVVYGVPRSLELLCVAIGALFLLLAAYHFYSQQIPRGTTGNMRTELFRSFVFLTLGAVTLQVCPSVTVLVYLAYVTYLSIQFWEVQSTDSTDNYMFLIAVSNCACFMGLVLSFTYLSNVVFGNFQVFYILVLWGAVVTFAVTITACYMVGIRKVFFYVNASYLAWILNTVIFFSYLYGRGELNMAYRLIHVHGHFFVIFVVLPLISQGLAYAIGAAAAAVYLTANKESAPEKEETEEPKKGQKAIEAPAPALLKGSDDDASE